MAQMQFDTGFAPYQHCQPVETRGYDAVQGAALAVHAYRQVLGMATLTNVVMKAHPLESGKMGR